MKRLKIRGNNIVKVLVIVVAGLMSFCCFENVSAKKCTSSNFSSSDNASIYRACEMVRKGRSARYGAMWISDSSSKSSIRDEVNITATSGKVNIYLHGLAICSGGGCIGHVKATYIKLIQRDKRGELCGNDYYKYSTWDALSSVPNNLNRPVINRSTTFTSGVDTMKLDIDKLKASKLPYTVSDGKRKYNVAIHPYRCMDGFYPWKSGCNCGW